MRPFSISSFTTLALLTGLTAPAFAITKAPSATSPTAANAAPPAPSALGKIVGRLSASENRTARDWAELGRETVTWGSQLQSGQQPVPEGPVRDALTAIDLGEKLDAKAADWGKLRDELEALLKKPDEDKQQDKDKKQQDKNDQKQNEDQKNQDQKNQDQKDQDQKSDQKKQDQSGQPQDKQDSSQKQDQNQKQDAKPPEPKPQSAFGDMNKKEEPPPPPPPQGTQKVGGPQENKDEPKQTIDPSLALPLQKLDQLRNQDSPAQLFQLMEGERKPAKKNSKDW